MRNKLPKFKVGDLVCHKVRLDSRRLGIIIDNCKMEGVARLPSYSVFWSNGTKTPRVYEEYLKLAEEDDVRE